MQKTIFALAMLFLLSMAFAFAHGEESFAEAEELVKQKVPCSELTDDQLELLGDYYMEQMHPGEAHEQMDEMMGGEGMMQMMGGGMMNQKYGGGRMMAGNWMGGTMGGFGFGWMFLYWIIGTAIVAFVFGIIFWLTYKLIIGNKRR